MKQFLVIQLLVVLPCIFVGNAHAYIDPGTGSMIIQGIIAAVAAIGVSVGIFWHRLKAFAKRVFNRDRSGGDNSDAN